MRQRNLLFLVMVFSVVFSLVALGCSKKEEPKTAVSQPAAPAPAPQAAPQPAAQPATQVPQATANPAPTQPPAAVLATADGEQPGTRVEVTELKRTSGGTVNLKFVMINDSDKKINFGYEFSKSASDYASISDITLMDEKNKKKYFVVRDSEGKCACSSGLKDLRPKDRVSLWAKFPAPSEDVQKISVVIPHFQPMDDVSISR